MHLPSLMVDIETMSTEPSAAILAIGAVHFDLSGDGYAATFSKRISLESNERAHRSFSASTILWWLQQSKEAQSALYEGQISPLAGALKEFWQWVGALSPKPQTVWAKDPDFDVVILKHAMGRDWPFKYSASRSVRTIWDLAYPGEHSPGPQGTAHDALTDAIHQVALVQVAYQELKQGSKA